MSYYQENPENLTLVEILKMEIEIKKCREDYEKELKSCQTKSYHDLLRREFYQLLVTERDLAYKLHPYLN